MAMKQNTIHALLTAALLPLALFSCTREELPSAPSEGSVYPLSITVIDSGYGAADGQTKATENGYRTEFTAGDECGLYIVRGGTVVYENIKLTATSSADGSLTWQPEAGTELGGGLDDETYCLYFPYQADMSGKVDVTATDAEGFFAQLVSGWQPKADQSTYAAYTASDLMTAKGTAAKGTDGTLSLSFSMNHCMAMAVIEMPPTVYKFTNTDVTIPDYTAASSADFTVSSVKPYGISSGTYRYIFNPACDTAASITGSYADGSREFTVTPNDIAANSCKTYKVDGARTVKKYHNLQIGDFLLADGSLVGKGETLTTGQQAACVGMVFYAGRHPNDNSNYSNPLHTGATRSLANNTVHGYAVALQDTRELNRFCMWGVQRTELGCRPTDASGKILDNYDNPDIDWNGYAWVRTIISNGAGSVDKLSKDMTGYPAVYYTVVDYESKVSAPAGSSGWFLPSIGQMLSVYRQRSILTTATGGNDLKTDWYWSSSEFCRDPANRALCVNVMASGTVGSSLKSKYYGYTRAVLAF